MKKLVFKKITTYSYDYEDITVVRESHFQFYLNLMKKRASESKPFKDLDFETEVAKVRNCNFESFNKWWSWSLEDLLVYTIVSSIGWKGIVELFENPDKPLPEPANSIFTSFKKIHPSYYSNTLKEFLKVTFLLPAGLNFDNHTDQEAIQVTQETSILNDDEPSCEEELNLMENEEDEINY